MASLKDLLRETLSSFRSSHRSVPGSEVIYHDTTIGSGIGNVASYVAPSDGIFVVQVETPATDLYIRKNDLDWNKLRRGRVACQLRAVSLRRDDPVVHGEYRSDLSLPYPLLQVRRRLKRTSPLRRAF